VSHRGFFYNRASGWDEALELYGRSQAARRRIGDVVANFDIWTMTADGSADGVVSGPKSETFPGW
jgi:hypothetical protein